MTTTTTSPEPPSDPLGLTDYGVSWAEYEAWSRVATCENGGWVGPRGSAYPDDLGINAHNWVAYGGGTDLRPGAQIAVARRIQSDPPDQDGACAPW